MIIAHSGYFILKLEDKRRQQVRTHFKDHVKIPMEGLPFEPSGMLIL